MDNRHPAELARQLPQAPVKGMARIRSLLERRPPNVVGPPPVLLERDELVRLHLDAQYAEIRNDDDEVDLRPQTSIPRRKIERVQGHPVVRPGGEKVEDIPLPRGGTIVEEGWYQSRHCSTA